MRGISIVICCYNSALRLPATLRALAGQKFDEGLRAEVIIVNNNSQDNTVEVAQNEWATYRTRISFKIVDESTPGLTAARKTGVAAAAHEYIVFCDDDNWLCETFLQDAVAIMETDPSIGAAGGYSESRTDGVFPDWWEQYKHAYAVGRQASSEGDISARKYIWGAGLVSRKALLLKIFDDSHPLLLTDRKGKSLSSGGDAEICHRILLLGYKLYYSEKLFFEHFIPKERLTQEYRIKLYDGMIPAYPILNKYVQVLDSLGLPKRTRWISSAKLLVKAGLLRLGFFKSEKKFILDTLSILLKWPRASADHDIRTIVQFMNFNH